MRSSPLGSQVCEHREKGGSWRREVRVHTACALLGDSRPWGGGRADVGVLVVCAASAWGSGRPAGGASCWSSPTLPDSCELYLGTQLPLRPVLVSSAATQGLARPVRPQPS